jgi:multiple sugar transport system ATP-binding protein
MAPRPAASRDSTPGREDYATARELGVTTMYVTHDQLEAMMMGTRIAVLRDGVLQQCGSPQAVHDEPANLFVPTFIGSPVMDVLPGRIERQSDGLVCRFGEARVPQEDMRVAAPGDATMSVRAQHLTERDGRSQLRGRATHVELLGAEQLVRVALRDGAVVTARFDAHTRVAPPETGRAVR